MNHSLAAEAARRFISSVWEGPPPDDQQVCRALDQLAADFHLLPDAQPADIDLDPPRTDFWHSSAKRFPDFGFYPVADPIGSIEDEIMMADAVDDVADITGDLNEVIWRHENIGPENACWYMRLMFFHWGSHMRGLATYLHARMFAA